MGGILTRLGEISKAQIAAPKFRVLALHETGGHHVAFTQRARIWLDELAAARNFAVEYVQNTDAINDDFLTRYQLIFQLDYPPYGWKPEAAASFERYIEAGKGGWIGLHHASLLGEFDGCPLWSWFSHFLGNIRYANYISAFAEASVLTEDADHPVMQGVPASFTVAQEEWYTYDRSPRPDVHVLARVDEATYQPDSPIKMGDHPVVWTNPSSTARNVYVFMGHSPILFDNIAYTTLLRNAIFWAVSASPVAASPCRNDYRKQSEASG